MTDPVLIVGAGPTGLTAALELSRMGVAVRLIDKRQAPAATSRAIGVQARTLELLEQRGLAEEMVRLGNKGRFASIYGDGKRVFRLDFGHVESRYPFMLLISQAETERILREAIARQGVTPQWNTELVGIGQDALSQDASPVQGILKLADGSLERVAAPWLISAEGAHSLVRTTLDLPFEGHTREEQYVLGDLLVAPAGQRHLHLFVRSRLHGPVPNGRRAFPPYRLQSAQQSFEGCRTFVGRITEDLRPALAHPGAVPRPGVELVVPHQQRMVSRLKVGRLLLGGDAAHIHSPAGAQGMNTGIQDMINLAWKLALVLKGQAPPALLDTYEQERLPVIRDVLAKTEGMTNVIGSGNVGPWAQEAAMAQDTIATGMCQLAIGYRDSPLSATYLQEGLHAGDRLPDLPVRYRSERGAGWQERTLFSLLDPSRFTLLAVRFAESAAAPADPYDAVQPWRPLIGVVELAPAPEAARERFQAVFGRSDGVFLVRPDGYVGFASGEHAWTRQLDAYCRLWLSAPAQVHTHAA